MTNLLFRILLVLHLCGLVLMAGTTVVDYFTFKLFCNWSGDRATGLLPIMARYGMLVRAGAVVLILTGVLMASMKTNWWDERWSRVKLVLVALLVLNGIFFGNSLGVKFRNMATDKAMQLEPWRNIIRDLNWFYLIQLFLFLLIIAVSVIGSRRQ